MQSNQNIKNIKPPSPFLRYIHNFRGIAILVIVMGHVIVYLDWSSSPLSYAICKALFKDGTVYFVFIAGFLFQYLSRKYVYSKYLNKKLNYVVVPYLLISIPAIAYCVLSDKISSDAWFENVFPSWTLPKQIITLYATGAHLYPLWFIPMVIILYLISPLLISLDNHPKLYWILVMLIPLCFIFPRPPINAIWQSFLYFLPAYILGMLASHYLKNVLLLTRRFLLPLSLISFGLFCLYAYQIFSGVSLDDTSLLVNTFNREIQCFLLIYALWYFDKKLSTRSHSILAFFANISFGLYFVHSYVISIYFKLLTKLPIIDALLENGNFAIFIFTSLLVIFISSLCVLIPQKYLGKNSRYLIGC